MTDRGVLSPEELISLRDDLDFAHTLMCLAVRRNLQAFSFAGIRIPKILQTWGGETDIAKSSGIATELATFQEQLYDRIVSLARNKRMLHEIWGFNEHVTAV